MSCRLTRDSWRSFFLFGEWVGDQPRAPSAGPARPSLAGACAPVRMLPAVLPCPPAHAVFAVFPVSGQSPRAGAAAWGRQRSPAGEGALLRAARCRRSSQESGAGVGPPARLPAQTLPAAVSAVWASAASVLGLTPSCTHWLARLGHLRSASQSLPKPTAPRRCPLPPGGSPLRGPGSHSYRPAQPSETSSPAERLLPALPGPCQAVC